MPKFMPKTTNMETPKTKETTIGITYPMLTKSNYMAWSIKMKAYMDAHGVWLAIEPKDPKVPVDEKTDKIALAAIYQGIPEDILLSIADKKISQGGVGGDQIVVFWG
ncbi:hypothetical protein AgCh_016699 [Apium graveolens]